MAEKSAQESQPSRSTQAGKAGPQADRTESTQGTPQVHGGRGSTAALQARSPFGRMGVPFGVSPFSLMRRVIEDMDRMFEDFRGGGRALGGGLPFGDIDVQRGGLPAVWTPAIEVVERDGQLVVRADLPGLRPEDVRIEVADGSLIIEGERRSEVEVEEEGVYRSERVYGRFSRVIPLPEGADLDKAQARFENGVLEVSVPLPEQARRRRIDIQGASGEAGKKPEGPSSVH
jgi:HSP20 family protein